MKDNLEQFILEHKRSFDERTPSLKVWAMVDKNLGVPKEERRLSVWKITRIAAAVVGLMVMGALIGNFLFKGSTSSSLAEINPEYTEIEDFYLTEINQKMALLTGAHYDQTIQEDLGQLDNIITDLKQELSAAPNGTEEQVINAIIRNYQIKVAILERVLQRVQSENQTNQNINSYETSEI